MTATRLEQLEHDLLTVDEAAAILRTDKDYVRRQCKAGVITARKLGKSWRIHRAALEQFMGAPGTTPATRKRGKSARQMRRSA